jgi:hypothetical protein
VSAVPGSEVWSRSEVGLLVSAARRAPVYGADHPWVLEPHGGEMRLYELPHYSLRDRLGLDGLLSCGAVLHNVHLALRHLGLRVVVDFPHDVHRPDLLAVIRTDGSEPPTEEEIRCYGAIEDAGSPGEVDLGAVIAANPWPGTDLAVLPVGLDLVRGHEALVVLTPGDTRQDDLVAGAALQAARPAARARGLRTRPMFRPLHDLAVRAALVERFALPGHPRALLEIDAGPRMIHGRTSQEIRNTSS